MHKKMLLSHAYGMLAALASAAAASAIPLESINKGGEVRKPNNPAYRNILVRKKKGKKSK